FIVLHNGERCLLVGLVHRHGGEVPCRQIAHCALQVVSAHVGFNIVGSQHSSNNLGFDNVVGSIDDFHVARPLLPLRFFARMTACTARRCPSDRSRVPECQRCPFSTRALPLEPVMITSCG